MLGIECSHKSRRQYSCHPKRHGNGSRRRCPQTDLRSVIFLYCSLLVPCTTLVLPLTCKWHTPPQSTTKFPNSRAEKRGIQFIRRSTTLSAITWAVDGIKPQLCNPSHVPLPCASVGGPGSALGRAREELRQSPPFKIRQILGKYQGAVNIRYYTSPPSTSRCVDHP